MDEFEFIAEMLGSLTDNDRSALPLNDDGAFLRPPAGMGYVVSTDAMAEGVHFLVNESPQIIARKLLRVNLSDLAAMGAAPETYFLTLALSPKLERHWLQDFVDGLLLDQQEFGLFLSGGDTVVTEGPMTFSATIVGQASRGRLLLRSGARPGHRLFVSGTIGDSALGLKMLLGELRGLGRTAQEHLIDRYRIPLPRVGLGRAIRGLASAAIDISDGLVADLGHICKASGVGADVDVDKVPLSEPCRFALAQGQSLLREVLTGGGDYELLFSAPEGAIGRLAKACRKAEVPITRIGTITEQEGVRFFGRDGRITNFGWGGYRHCFESASPSARSLDG